MAPLPFTLRLLFLLPLLGTAFAQQGSSNPSASGPCPVPVFSNSSSEPNMFTEQQEEWLGDIIDESFRKQFHVIEDPGGAMQKLGEKLVAQLPPSRIHYRFYIVDAPEVNSFGIVGGRIYIFRRIIAFTQNEGELAALLGHEIGHIATHQSAIEFSTIFRDLGITQVGDRQDLLHKWNQLVDNEAKVHIRFSEKREQREQLVADHVGIYAMARAGYDPARSIEFLDRLLQTQGKTGGFWSDFLGKTSEESKRLREAMRSAAPLPAGCAASLPPDSESRFLNWKRTVLESRAASVHEDVPGQMAKIALRPKLRDDLRSIKFSPDGKYLLAQDNSSVFVLSRDPLANLFRIDAPDTYLADFTPDSGSIVFLDKELRVEKWDISSQQRAWVHAVGLPVHCLQAQLSPSGEQLACLTTELELQVIDVGAGTVTFLRKKFYEPVFADIVLLELAVLFGNPVQMVQIQFSPDNHYLLIGRGRTAFGYDLTTRAEIKLSSKVKELMANAFAFVSPDEITGYRYQAARVQLAFVKFPGGESVDEFPLQVAAEIAAPRKGDYLLLSNTGGPQVGVVDVKARKILMAYKTPGFSIYDHQFAGETVGGSVALFELTDKTDQKPLSIIQLPDSPLAWPRAASFSDNGKWLALANASRGGLWNLETGERIFHTQHFEGAFFDGDRLVAKFPQHDKVASAVFAFDPSNSSTSHLYDVPSNGPTLPSNPGGAKPQEGVSGPAWQMEGLVVTFAREPKDKTAARLFLKVFDVRSNKQLWERGLKSRPGVFYSRPGKTMTMVIGDYESIKSEAESDARLAARLNAIEGKLGKQDSYVLRVLDAATGNDLGAVLVDTGNLSFRVTKATAVRDTVLVEDNLNRTLIYSLKSGNESGKVFGRARAVSNTGALLLAENGNGQADLYEVASLKSLAHYTFPERIAYAQFLPSDSALMVVTADQTVYRLQVPAGGPASNLP